nr:MAG TPA: hypothetical protein [Caudoviricetes sp.]
MLKIAGIIFKVSRDFVHELGITNVISRENCEP